MKTFARVLLMLGLVTAVSQATAHAHCDALDGPVVKAARAALEAGDVGPVLQWVALEREAEVREAFERTRRVRAAGGDAEALADTWFFETLVRIHRAGEGASFDGLKPAGSAEPFVLAVDRTLASGSVDELAARMAAHVAAGVRERFARAHEAQAHAGHNVEAGRRFVAAYVEYMHYVEGIHRAVAGAGAHGTGTEAAGHAHPK